MVRSSFSHTISLFLLIIYSATIAVSLSSISSSQQQRSRTKRFFLLPKYILDFNTDEQQEQQQQQYLSPNSFHSKSAVELSPSNPLPIATNVEPKLTKKKEEVPVVDAISRPCYFSPVQCLLNVGPDRIKNFVEFLMPTGSAEAGAESIESRMERELPDQWAHEPLVANGPMAGRSRSFHGPTDKLASSLATYRNVQRATQLLRHRSSSAPFFSPFASMGNNGGGERGERVREPMNLMGIENPHKPHLFPSSSSSSKINSVSTADPISTTSEEKIPHRLMMGGRFLRPFLHHAPYPFPSTSSIVGGGGGDLKGGEQ